MAVLRAVPIVVLWPWRRQALGATLVVAAVLNSWQLSQVGYGNTYYAAVRSMLQNWHAFLFNAFDANGFVTIDKPPLGFWLQVAGAKLFGYSGFSLILPEALAGLPAALGTTTTTACSGDTPNPAAPGGAGGSFTRDETGNPGPLRLFNSALGGARRAASSPDPSGPARRGLAAPTALPARPVGAVAGAVGDVAPHHDVFFIIAGFFHAYYVVMLGPACSLWPRLIRAQET